MIGSGFKGLTLIISLIRFSMHHEQKTKHHSHQLIQQTESIIKGGASLIALVLKETNARTFCLVQEINCFKTSW